MHRFNVTIMRPEGYIEASAFQELAESYRFGFEALGHSATLTENTLVRDGVNVLFGVNVYREFPALRFPSNVVLVNLEQFVAGSSWFTPSLLDAYGTNVLWDYSPANIAALRAAGLSGPISLVPVGTMPQLCRIPSAKQDIDVLFFGALSERRLRIVQALKAAGVAVQCIAGYYGAERDRWIARSKIVLMLRNAENYRIFEIVRAAYLMSNAKTIVSEWDDKTEIEPDIAQGIVLARSDELAAVCSRLIRDAPRRQSIGALAQQIITARRQSELLRPAIAALPPTVFPR
jgi:hypothetical protein